MTASTWLYVLRHLRHHWRIHAVILLCLTLASAVLMGFSSYSALVATKELQQSFEEATPRDRSILISGNRFTFNDALYNQLQSVLGRVIKDRLVTRHSTSPADSQSATVRTGQKLQVGLLELYSFDRLSERVVVVDGRLADQVRLLEAVDTWRPPPIEAVIGIEAARQSGYGIGDRISGSGTYHRLEIVGVVAPLDPHDDIWGGDPRAFRLSGGNPGYDIPGIALPLIISPASMRSHYPERPIFPHEISWRITLNHHHIGSSEVEAVHSGLINFQAQTATVEAATDTGLVLLLADYLARVSQARMVFSLLSAQAFLMVLYTLTVLASFVVQSSQNMIRTLAARGASTWQITKIFAMQSLPLALPSALFLGPGLSQAGIFLWDRGTITGSLMPIPREAWLLSVAGAAMGWLALVLVVYRTARRTSNATPGFPLVHQTQSGTQRLYLDLYLLIFSGLLYWQLNQAGSFVLRQLRETQLADPLLLIGPTLFMIAGTMVALRVLPILLQLAVRILNTLPGMVLPLGVHHLAQDAQQTGRLVLLIGLTTGLALFTHYSEASLAAGQQAIARYSAGADMRISIEKPTVVVVNPFSALPGVQTVTQAHRTPARSADGRTMSLLIVDPDSLPQDAHILTGRSSVTIPGLIKWRAAGDNETNSSPVPVVISMTALPQGIRAAEIMHLELDWRTVAFIVRAVSDPFPTLSGNFVGASLTALETQLDATVLGRAGSREAWLAIEPHQISTLPDHPVLEERRRDDRNARLQAVQSDALAQGILSAFRLSTLAILFFGAAAYILMQYMVVYNRGYEFEVLGRLGLSSSQLLLISAWEGVLVLGLGLAAGWVLGTGLSYVMLPHLFQVLKASLTGSALQRSMVEWPGAVHWFALVIAVYGSALGILLLALIRSGTLQFHWDKERG